MNEDARPVNMARARVGEFGASSNKGINRTRISAALVENLNPSAARARRLSPALGRLLCHNTYMRDLPLTPAARTPELANKLSYLRRRVVFVIAISSGALQLVFMPQEAAPFESHFRSASFRKLGGEPNNGIHPTGINSSFIRQLGCLLQSFPAGDAGR
jgi:hypothetical protein